MMYRTTTATVVPFFVFFIADEAKNLTFYLPLDQIRGEERRCLLR